MMTLVLCITMMVVPVSASTDWVNSDDIKYKVDGGYLYFRVTSESSVDDDIEIKELSLTGADESISGKIIIPKEIQGGRVIKIDDAAFAYCNKMTELEIPESIEDMYEYGGLGFCDKLESINVDLNNKKYSSDKGVLLNKAKTEILLCPKAKRGKYTVPDTVKKLGNAFNGCAGLTQLELPDSIVKINKNAFSNCENLSKIRLSTKLKEIGSFAFWNCGLKEIDIPDSVTYIGSAAFKECYKLKKISLSKNMKKINTDTFDSCGFTEVHVSGNIKTIGTGAFSWCNKLEKVYIEDGVKEICLSAFSACNLKKVFIPKSVKKIDNAFEVVKPKKNKAKIYGYKGSYAEKYAKKYKMPFVNISLAAPAKVTCKLKDKSYIKTTWSKVKGASGYAVYGKSSENKKYKLIKYTKNRYISEGELKNGVKYTFKVVPYMTVDKKKYFGKGKAASLLAKNCIETYTYSSLNILSKHYNTLAKGEYDAVKKDGVWYYRFSDNSNILYIRSDAFMNEMENDFTDVDVALTECVNKGEKSGRTIGTVCKAGRTEKDTVLNADKHISFIAKMNISVTAPTEGNRITLQNNMIAQTNFTYCNKIRERGTAFVPSNARQYKKALKRNSESKNFRIVPEFAIKITDAGKNNNYLAENQIAGKGVAETDTDIDKLINIGYKVGTVSVSGLNISTLYGLYKEAVGLDADGSEYQSRKTIILSQDMNNKFYYCMNASFKSPIRIGKKGEYFEVPIVLDKVLNTKKTGMRADIKYNINSWSY